MIDETVLLTDIEWLESLGSRPIGSAMALPVIPGVYRCFLQFAGPSNTIIGNVVHVEASGSPTGLQVAQAVGKAWAATGSMYEAQATVTQYQQVVCTPLDGSSISASDAFTTAAHTAGAQGGTVYPANTAAVLRLRTGQRGRSHRGRIYLGQVIASNSSNLFTWSSSYLTTLTSAGAGFQAALVAGSPSLNLSVASYKLQTALPVITISPNPQLCTVRLRLRA